MPVIAATVDIEEGHMFPLLGLLRQLRNGGYKICCLGLADVEDFVRSQNFEFFPILSNVFPKGSLDVRSKEAFHAYSRLRNQHLPHLIRGEVMDDVISKIKPNGIIVHSQYCIEGLAIYYRYRLPTLFYLPNYRVKSRLAECERITSDLMNITSGLPEFLELITGSGVRFKNLQEVAQLFLQFHELVLTPKALNLPGQEIDSKAHYIGAGVDFERSEEPFQWDGVDLTRPIIYCALGSQSHIGKETSRRFIRTVIETASMRPNWQFIIATGKVFEEGEISTVTPNVRTQAWVPQLEVLAHSSLMINHAGFGTVKECILKGVPMVVFPLLSERDHAEIAKRVVYHELGLAGNIEKVSKDELSSLIDQVIQDQAFKQRVEIMREKFLQEETLGLGIKVIESVIGKPD
jgi:zeaxanthin glucosyltransferase